MTFIFGGLAILCLIGILARKINRRRQRSTTISDERDPIGAASTEGAFIGKLLWMPVLLGIGVAGWSVFDAADAPSIIASSRPIVTPAPVALPPPLPPPPPTPVAPDQEHAMLGIIARFADAYRGAPNEAARVSVRPRRAAALCAALKGPAVKDWVGRVETMSPASRGEGILILRLSDQVSIGTNSGSRADAAAHTLIKAGSQLANQAAFLRAGQWVRFSGAFVHAPEDCNKELSPAYDIAMTNPTFLFRFTDIQPAQ